MLDSRNSNTVGGTSQWSPLFVVLVPVVLALVGVQEAIEFVCGFDKAAWTSVFVIFK